MLNYSVFYKLVGREVQQCLSFEDFIEAHNNKWQWKTYVRDKTVSTVFLVLNRRFSDDGSPVLFETMVIPDQEICKRYCTYEEAVKGHGEIVEQIKKNQKGHAHAGTDN